MRTQNTKTILIQLHPFLDRDALLIINNALVTSHLVYFNTLYIELPLKNIWKLQLVQNVAAHVINDVAYTADVTPLLHDLHWLPVCFWVQFKVLIVTFKALFGFLLGLTKELPIPKSFYPSNSIQ